MVMFEFLNCDLCCC